MDTTQIVIAFVSVTLTILMVVLGVQVYFILQEIRRILQKMNKMLADFGKVTGMVSDTAEGMSGFLNGIKTGLSLVTHLKNKGEANE